MPLGKKKRPTHQHLQFTNISRPAVLQQLPLGGSLQPRSWAPFPACALLEQKARQGEQILAAIPQGRHAKL
jgi:hypothetical protein